MTLTLSPPMPPTARRPLPRYAEGGGVPMPPGKALPRFEEGGNAVGDELARRMAFLQAMTPYAQAWSQQTGVPTEVYLAMMASESNFGAAASYFGIKGPSPSGRTGRYGTWEQNATGGRDVIEDDFAEYDSPDEGFAHLMAEMNTQRYKPAWDQFQRDKDWKGWIGNIQKSGWATDTSYADYIDSLSQTIKGYQAGRIGGTALGGLQPRRQTSPYSSPVGGSGSPRRSSDQPVYASGGRVPMPPAGRALPRFEEGGATDTERTRFVQSIWPYALRWAQQTGIPPEIFVGIGASETNWGRAGGFFGIKGASPKGKSATYATFEYDANGNRYDTNDQFAVYDNADEGFQHFMSLVSSPGSRYEGAWKRFQQDGNVQNFLGGLVNAGYATDKNWPNNIMALGRQAKMLADPNAKPAPAAVAGNGGAQGGTGTTTVSTDPFLKGLFDQAMANMQALQAERDKLKALPTRTEDQNNRLLMLETTYIPSALAEVTKLYATVRPGTTESPTQQALAQSQIAQNNVEMWGTRQGAITNILGALRQMTTDAFGAKKDEANFLLDILTTSFNQAAKVNELAVQRGQLDLNGYIALTEAQALQQTAEAARAMKAMELAGAINANDWALAERALPAGTHYQPMFGPNDPLPSIMRQMGLGDATMRAAPIDMAKLDLRNTLRETPGLLNQLGYSVPNFSVDKVAAQVEANKDIPQFTAQPVQPQNFASVWPKAPTSDYDTLTQFLNMQMSEIQGYDPFAQPNVTQLTNPAVAAPTTATATVTPPAQTPVNLPAQTGANSFTGGQAGAVPPAWVNPGGTGAAAKPQAAYPAVSTGWGGKWGIPGPAGLGWEIDPQTGQLRRKAGT